MYPPPPTPTPTPPHPHPLLLPLTPTPLLPHLHPTPPTPSCCLCFSAAFCSAESPPTPCHPRSNPRPRTFPSCPSPPPHTVLHPCAAPAPSSPAPALSPAPLSLPSPPLWFAHYSSLASASRRWGVGFALHEQPARCAFVDYTLSWQGWSRPLQRRRCPGLVTDRLTTVQPCPAPPAHTCERTGAPLGKCAWQRWCAKELRSR